MFDINGLSASSNFFLQSCKRGERTYIADVTMTTLALASDLSQCARVWAALCDV